MGRFETTRQMQWNNDLASLANQALYGIDYCLRHEEEKRAQEFIDGGIKLCSLLKEGCEATQLPITTPKQLEVIKVFAPLRAREIKAEELIKKTKEALSVLGRLREEESVAKEEITNVQDFLQEISEHYLKTAYSILATSHAKF